MKVLKLLVAAVAVGTAVPAQAQNGDHVAQNGSEVTEATPRYDYPSATPVPFGPGEYLEYQVKLGMFGVGSGHMSVLTVDSVRGNPAYHVRMGIDGGFTFVKVRDQFDSWMDLRSLISRRFIKDQNEAGYVRYQHFEFFPEERRFERGDNDETGELPTSLPLDDISFVYFVRTLPLEVGKEYTFHRYFKDDGNPVVIKVLRRDRVKVPAGEFNTIVVQPIIQSSGLWSEGGEAEIHFSDDENRFVVYMKSDVPHFPGSLTLHLREIEAGQALSGTPFRSDQP